jgi:subtilase family serine protease
MGMAATCVVAAALVAAGSPPGVARFQPDGATFVPDGPMSASAVAAGKGGKPNALCPGKVCYTPQQLQAAYDYPTGKNAPTGAGQTIVIVVAYGSPTIESDLASFDALFGIPPATLSYCGTNGVNQGDPDAPSWGPETSADVEYAHAMAPGASIVLAVAPSDDDNDVANTAASCLPKYPGAIVSQSFGDDEDLIPADAVNTLHTTFGAAVAAGGTLIAGTGDFGASDGDPYPIAAYPASDPLVTAVGGTEGLPYPGGLLRGNSNRYGAEQVWNEGDTFDLATGGAPSMIFPRPGYQNGFTNSSTRTVSDVAWNASINGGELVVFDGQVGNFGGTSTGPPPWSAIFALADEQRAQNHQDSLGQANPELYAIAAGHRNYNQDFHDITQGTNALDSDIGYQAGPGYDLPTGLGTPDVSNLLSDLTGGPSNHHGDGNGDPGRPGHGGNGHGGRHRAWAGG